MKISKLDRRLHHVTCCVPPARRSEIDPIWADMDADHAVIMAEVTELYEAGHVFTPEEGRAIHERWDVITHFAIGRIEVLTLIDAA